MYKKINPFDCTLLIIDIQEKLVGMLEKNTIAEKSAILSSAAKAINVPTIVSEQYPQGLGSTIISLKEKLPDDASFYEKNTFSAFENTEIADALKKNNKKQVILCGIETHICVLQTAIDLINNGYEVFVVQDACASRNKNEFKLAIDRMKHSGAIITCTEMVIFELLKSSKHPKFKELQQLIK